MSGTPPYCSKEASHQRTATLIVRTSAAAHRSVNRASVRPWARRAALRAGSVNENGAAAGRAAGPEVRGQRRERRRQ